MNYDSIQFNKELSQKRFEKAVSILGEKVILKIIAFAMYLLGATRSSIAGFTKMPEGSVRSLIRAFHYRGLTALEDLRSGTSDFKTPLPPDIRPYIEHTGDYMEIKFGIGNKRIRIPKDNMHQKRIVLLTLLESELLSISQVSENLNLSGNRTGKLVKLLHQKDVSGVIDQRRGQQRDYLFTPEIKAELIQQFIIDIVTQGSTSGEQLSQGLKERCHIKLAPRTILYHISLLGLSGIKTSLPAYLDRLKKTP